MFLFATALSQMVAKNSKTARVFGHLRASCIACFGKAFAKRREAGVSARYIDRLTDQRLPPGGGDTARRAATGAAPMPPTSIAGMSLLMKSSTALASWL